MVQTGKLYEINIRKGREHRAFLTPDRVNDPREFFVNAYQDAKFQLAEIVGAAFRWKEKDNKGLPAKKQIELLHEYPNNVIAFCADRGRGKTTAMLSFSNALEMLGGGEKDASAAFWGNLLQNTSAPYELLGTQFEVMSSIDPATWNLRSATPVPPPPEGCGWSPAALCRTLPARPPDWQVWAPARKWWGSTPSR